MTRDDPFHPRLAPWTKPTYVYLVLQGQGSMTLAIIIESEWWLCYHLTILRIKSLYTPRSLIRKNQNQWTGRVDPAVWGSVPIVRCYFWIRINWRRALSTTFFRSFWLLTHRFSLWALRVRPMYLPILVRIYISINTALPWLGRPRYQSKLYTKCPRQAVPMSICRVSRHIMITSRYTLGWFYKVAIQSVGRSIIQSTSLGSRYSEEALMNIYI